MPAPPPTRPHLVTAALLLGTFLAALDLNVVGTSMPTVVGQLGGLQLYGLVFSAYLLTSTTTIPLYGRLADLYGRKPVYLTAALLFIVGSALCGAARSMAELIAFRALQGLGAGGLIPITITLFGDLYPAERRALIQGLFSAVWGVSSVLGPLIGGFVVTYVSWRWVFWLNLPAGLLAAVLLMLSLREQVERKLVKLDLPGAVLLTLCLVALLLGLQGIGEEGNRTAAIGLIGAAAILGLSFVRLELRSSRPLLPLSLFSDRSMLVTSLSGLPLGGVLSCTVTLVPLYVQGVLHGSPTRAGLALVPLSITWTLATFITGVLARRLGYRPVVILGSLSCCLGTAALVLVPSSGALLVRHVAMVAVGAGMGLTITATTIAAQDNMAWSERGVATALIQFSRTIGGMITVTVLGVVVTSLFARGLDPQLVAGIQPSELLDPQRWSSLSPETLALAQRSMQRALLRGFIAIATLGLLTLAVSLAFPALRMRRTTDQ